MTSVAVVRKLILTLGVGLLALFGLARAPQSEPLPSELAWVGLFNGEVVSWLENANRLDELCGADRTTDAWSKCRAEKLQTRSITITVRTDPRRDADSAGEIMVHGEPGVGLRASAHGDGTWTPFTPDLYDVDWGYGPPWFHQTVLAQQDSWFRIPVPVVGVGWVDAREWRTDDRWPDLKRTLRPGEIIETPWGSRVVASVQDGVLGLRGERKEDSPCEHGEAPTPAPREVDEIPFRLLFNDEGHLLVTYKYTRGC